MKSNKYEPGLTGSQCLENIKLVFSKRLGLIGNQGNIWLDNYLITVMVCGLVGFLAVRGCTNTVLFLLLIPALAEIRQAGQVGNLVLLRPLIITLSLPFLAILFSQALRQDWILRAYDAPLRILLSIPVLFYFCYKQVDFSRLISLCAAPALLFLLPIVLAHPEIWARWGGRFATEAVDPTQFGTYTLVLTMFCLFSMDNGLKSNQTLLIMLCLGLFAGLYLLTGSETRGSWIAIPPLLVLWFWLKGNKIQFKTLLAYAAMAVVGILLVYLFHPKTIDRFFSGFQEISAWLDGSERESSTGLRLTMWQMSWEFFIRNPIHGYGDMGFGEYLNQSWIADISSPESRRVIQYNGPHNELLANLLRSGVFGGVSVICLFLVPFRLFWKSRNDPLTQKASHFGLAYLVSLLFCSISSEVWTFKYTSTFYGLIICGLSAQIITIQSANRKPAT